MNRKHLPPPCYFFLLLTLMLPACAPDPQWEINEITAITTDPVKELDALQTVNGSLIMAAMERPARGLLDYGCVVYRSTDDGKAWTKTLVLEDSTRYTRQFADPRLVEDTINNRLYLVVMEVKLPAERSTNRYRRDYFLGDIAVYRSDDDGLNWRYQSHPHVDPEGAYGDLPYPLVDPAGCLLIFYSRLDTRKLIDPSDLVIRRSCDGGLSWSEDYLLGDSLIANTRKNLGNLIMKDARTMAGTFTDQDQLYYFEIEDEPGNRLKTLRRIPHGFGGQDLPIVFLDRDKISGRLGILAYLPHERNSIIWHFLSEDDGQSWVSHKLPLRGAYPNVLPHQQGFLITFNRKERKNYQLLYSFAEKPSGPLSDPEPLFQGKYDFTEAGEYQALFQGRDGKSYLFFCDWSDYSRGKVCVLEQHRNAR
jgi:hypothetical protein